MAMTKAQKFEGMAKMLLAARKAENKRATTEKFCVENALSWEVYSAYTAYLAEMAVYLYPYYQKRREETALGAQLMDEKERKALKDPIWKPWSELLHGLGLKCHKDDFECIWKCYERIEKVTGAITPGGNTDYQFRKNIDIELGIRLAKVKAMTPAELEFHAEQQRLTRQKKGLDGRLKDTTESIRKLEETLEMLKASGIEEEHKLYRQFEDDLEQAKATLADVENKIELWQAKNDACTLENVKMRLEAEKAIKKLTADDLKKEKEAEEEPKEEKKTVKKAKKEAEKK